MNNGPYRPNPSFQPWRMVVVYGLVIFIFVFFVIRLFSLQIVDGPDYLSRADDNRQNLVSVPTQRGIIYDRNGFVLARNVASYDAVIVPANLPTDPGAIQDVYRNLSALIGIPVSQGNTDDETVKVFKPCDNDLGITQIVFIGDTNAPYTPVKVKCNIDPKTAMIIRERAADLPGVDIEITPVRDYPTGSLTSEIIGFLGPIPAAYEAEYRKLGFVPNRDKVGFAGVELSQDDLLLGKNGERLVEVDVAGKELRNLEAPIPPVPGNNIKLTIDTRLQTAAKAALKNEMATWNRLKPEYGLTNGVVIAMNPKTGEILALVSEPTYENNRLARQIPFYYYNQIESDPQKPLFNQAISAEHPPGSVFKMATAVGILNEGVVSANQFVDDPGKIEIIQKFTPNDPGTPIDFVCYLYKTTGAGHGLVDYIKGVAQSCDVYFYKVGGGYQDEVKEGLNIWRIGEYAKALGYGQPTGIELPGERPGLIPDPNWKRVNLGETWATGDTYIATIGQGFVLATPMQVLVSFATLANDGKMMQPTLIKEVLNSQGEVVKPFTPKLKWDITVDPKIQVYDENFFPTGQLKTVDPAVIQKAKEAMREVVVSGTASTVFSGFNIPSAGKTGTAEYCDNIAQEKNKCKRGNWPAHAWYAGYAPFDNPEIVVLAFVYNGQEGSVVAGPVVRQVMEAYFELKAIDSANPIGSQNP